MPNFIDISLPLTDSLPIWPGSAGFSLIRVKTISSGEPANVSTLNSDVHVGTHVDAPFHFLSDGITTESLDLGKLIGNVHVVSFPNVDAITADDLEDLQIASPERLLFKTKNSLLWKERNLEFQRDYVALTLDAAQWIVDQNVQLVGIDYLSIQRVEDNPETHRVLLRDEVVILEGLDLSSVEPGEYELICLPLRLVGADGAPARAVLRSYD